MAFGLSSHSGAYSPLVSHSLIDGGNLSDEILLRYEPLPTYIKFLK